VTLALVTGVTQRDLYITFVTVTCLGAYICGLPKLFLAFKKSFSFGEGCLVLQVVLLYTAHSFIHLHNDNNASQLLLEVDSNGNTSCNTGNISNLFKVVQSLIFRVYFRSTICRWNSYTALKATHSFYRSDFSKFYFSSTLKSEKTCL
jgi:hypothetical protein